MREVNYFMAEDGTKFDDRYECVEYELKQMNENCGVYFYDKHLNRLSIDENGYNEAVWIKITDRTKTSFLEEFERHYGCQIPTEKGLYWYDKMFGVFINADDELDRRKRVFESFRDDVEKVILLDMAEEE